MLLTMLLAQAVMPQAEATPTVESEIVVMGRRMDRWTGKYQIRGTRRKCSTKTSSGDLDIDKVGCVAFLECADRHQALVDAGDAKNIDRQTRVRLKQSAISTLKLCIADRRSFLLTQLAARRRPSGQR